MGLWSGCDVLVGSESLHVDTLYDMLDKMGRVPERPMSALMHMPISGIYNVKVVGDVLAGRVQGVVDNDWTSLVYLGSGLAMRINGTSLDLGQPKRVFGVLGGCEARCYTMNPLRQGSVWCRGRER